MIGDPSDSKRSLYCCPVSSVAEQTTLETWPAAKLPSCTHRPEEATATGTGRPSTFGRVFELRSIRSIAKSYKLSFVRWLENEMM
jgi:hypothetical protein